MPSSSRPRQTPARRARRHAAAGGRNHSKSWCSTRRAQVRRAGGRVRRASAKSTPGHQAASAASPRGGERKGTAPGCPIPARSRPASCAGTWSSTLYLAQPLLRAAPLKVEQMLVDTGRDLYHAALPPAHTANVLQAWTRIDGHARRFSILVDPALEDSAAEAEVSAPRHRSRHCAAVPALGAAATARPSSSRAPPQPRAPGACPTPACSTCPCSPRRFVSCWSARGRRTAATSTTAPAPAAGPTPMEALPGQVRPSRSFRPATLPALAAELERARDTRASLPRGAFRRPWHVQTARWTWAGCARAPGRRRQAFRRPPPHHHPHE